MPTFSSNFLSPKPTCLPRVFIRHGQSGLLTTEVRPLLEGTEVCNLPCSYLTPESLLSPAFSLRTPIGLLRSLAVTNPIYLPRVIVRLYICVYNHAISSMQLTTLVCFSLFDCSVMVIMRCILLYLICNVQLPLILFFNKGK